MSNNKQSSVEWLIEQILLKHPIITQFLPNWNFDKSIIEQAKAMHKEEIIKSMSVAFIDGAKIGGITYESPYEDWEQYYNETFNNEQTN